jgi:hypothetical protein
MQSDAIADHVLGQTDFVSNSINAVTASSMYDPSSVAVDTTATPNRLYVADTANNRVLGWRDLSAFTNGSPADLVIGQADFSSSGYNNGFGYPASLALDSAGNLYVGNWDYGQVLEFDVPFSSCSSFPCVAGPANIVLSGISGPRGLAFDPSGNLYVSEEDRAVGFDSVRTQRAPPAGCSLHGILWTESFEEWLSR